MGEGERAVIVIGSGERTAFKPNSDALAPKLASVTVACDMADNGRVAPFNRKLDEFVG